MIFLWTLFPCLTPATVRIKACKKIKMVPDKVSPIKIYNKLTFLTYSLDHLAMIIEAKVCIPV